MNANSTLQAPLPKAAARRAAPISSATETLPVPARWRAGQLFFIALVALGASVYNHFFIPWSAILSAVKAGDFKAALSLFSLADQLGFVLLAAMIWLCTPAAPPSPRQLYKRHCGAGGSSDFWRFQPSFCCFPAR